MYCQNLVQLMIVPIFGARVYIYKAKCVHS